MDNLEAGYVLALAAKNLIDSDEVNTMLADPGFRSAFALMGVTLEEAHPLSDEMREAIATLMTAVATVTLAYIQERDSRVTSDALP